MTGTLQARLRRGLGGQAFSQAVAFAIQIGSVPLYLGFWGTSLFGEWLVLAAFPAYLVISDLGFTTATSNEVTMRVSRGDVGGALGAFQTTWAFVTVISVLVAALLVGGALLSPIAEWFAFTRLTDTGAALVLALLLFQVLVNIQTGLAAAGLISAGQYGLHAFLTALTRLVAFLVVIVVLVLGQGPVVVAAVMAGVECLGFVTVLAFARHHSAWLHHGFSRVSGQVFRRLATPSIGFAGFVLGNAISVQGPIIVIGAILGPTAVAIFATLRILARAVVMFANVVFATLRPEIAIAYGRDDLDLMRRLNTRAIQFALWLSVAAFAGLMVLGPWIVDIWTVGRIAVQQPLFAFLVLGGVGTLMWTGTATALYATNNSKEISAIYVISMAAGLAIAAVAAYGTSLSGAAMVLALAEFCAFVLILMRSQVFLDQPYTTLLRGVLRPPTDALKLFRRAA